MWNFNRKIRTQSVACRTHGKQSIIPLCAAQKLTSRLDQHWSCTVSRLKADGPSMASELPKVKLNLKGIRDYAS